MPQDHWRAAEAKLPDALEDVALVMRYNTLTGASLSHFDIGALGIFELDELRAIVSYADSLKSDHAE